MKLETLASDAPVFACTLPPPELRRRRLEVLSDLRRKVRHIDETPEGFTFRFTRAPGLEEELAEFVRFEAACCAFIHMDVAPHGERELALHMKGAAGAKPFMRAEFVEAGVDEEPAQDDEAAFDSCGFGDACCASP
jgi:hypothetical protein